MRRKSNFKNGAFTLIEILIVIAIIGILSSVVLGAVNTAREKAYYVKAKGEFRSIVSALELYKDDNGGEYPDDVGRGVSPDGLERYLSSNSWTESSWPGSILDWDVYDSYPGPVVTRQISIRFCESGTCRFPRTEWAADFEDDSAVYYCIEGPCKSHPGHDDTYPGHCVNCD